MTSLEANRLITNNVSPKMFDQRAFIKSHGMTEATPEEVMNPEKRVKKLLLKLLDLWS